MAKYDPRAEFEELTRDYSPERKQMAATLLSRNPEILPIIRYVEKYFPEDTADHALKIALRETMEGKRATYHTFAKSILDELDETDNYDPHAVDTFVEKGYISRSDGEKIKRRHIAERGERLHKGLEGLIKLRKAAVFFFLTVSALFLLKSLFSGGYTAAVIGGGVADLDIIYGIIFLLLGLALAHFYLRKH